MLQTDIDGNCFYMCLFADVCLSVYVHVRVCVIVCVCTIVCVRVYAHVCVCSFSRSYLTNINDR